MHFSSASIRTKLTVMTVLLLAVLYLLLGAVVQFMARQAIYSSIDTSLIERGRFMAVRARQELAHPMAFFGGRPPIAPLDKNDKPLDDMSGPHMFWTNPKMAYGPRGAPYDADALAAGRSGRRSLAELVVSGRPMRLLTLPVKDPSGNVFLVIQIPYLTADVQNTLRGLNRTLLILLPIVLLLTGFASLFIIDRAIRPVKQITEASEHMGAKDLGARLPVVGKDEFAVLAQTLNGLLGRLESTFLLQNETMDRLNETVQQQRRFTADASHELKTPLAVIKANVGLLRSPNLQPQDLAEWVTSIDEAATRMTRLVQDLLLLARTDAGQLMERVTLCDLRQIAQVAVQSVGTQRPVEVIVSSSKPVLVSGIPNALERVVSNLVDNACRHTDPEKAITVEVFSSGSTALVCVMDQGDGIAPEHLEHLFERFYRIDTSRESSTGGTGLGLAICKGIVEAHGGRISVESSLGKGTVFQIEIPVAEPQSASTFGSGEAPSRRTA